MNSHTKHKNGHLENMCFSAFFGLVGISRSYVILKPLVGIFRSEVISKPLVGHASQCHVADSLFRHSTAFAVQLKGQHVGIQVGTCLSYSCLVAGDDLAGSFSRWHEFGQADFRK